MKLHILAVLTFCLAGCGIFSGARDIVDWHAKYVTLQKQYSELALKKAPVVKFVDRFIPQETVKVVKDTEWQMGLLKIIGAIGIALSAGATFFLRTFNLQVIGMSGVVAFGSLFVLALVTQITTPFLPYLALAMLTIFCVMVVIWVAMHVDWKDHEKKGINDLAAGIKDSIEAKKLLSEAGTTTWLQTLTKLWHR